MTTDSSGVRLGDLLTGAGLLQAADLREAMLISKQQGLPVGRVLIMSGFLTETHLQAAVQAQSLLKDGLIDFDTVIKALSMVGSEELSLDDAFRKLKYSQQSDAVTNKLGELLMAADIVPIDSLNSALLQCQSIGLPLGRVLVASGALTEQMLAAALNAQVFIRDRKLSREQAITGLKSAKERQIPIEQYLAETGALQLPTAETVRLGELLVLAKVLDEPSLMGAVELGLINEKPIGQVLLESKLINEEMLNSALELQRMVAAGAIRKAEAGAFLTTVNKKGVSVQEAIKSSQPAPVPSPAALSLAPEGLPLYQFLQVSGIITSKQIEQAIRIGSKDSEIMGKMLLMAGILEPALVKAAQQCNELIGTGVLTTEQGMIALKSCERNSFALDQAFNELGWDTSPLKAFGAVAESPPPKPHGLAAESIETKTLEAAPLMMDLQSGQHPAVQAADAQQPSPPPLGASVPPAATALPAPPGVDQASLFGRPSDWGQTSGSFPMAEAPQTPQAPPALQAPAPAAPSPSLAAPAFDPFQDQFGGTGGQPAAPAAEANPPNPSLFGSFGTSSTAADSQQMFSFDENADPFNPKATAGGGAPAAAAPPHVPTPAAPSGLSQQELAADAQQWGNPDSWAPGAGPAQPATQPAQPPQAPAAMWGNPPGAAPVPPQPLPTAAQQQSTSATWGDGAGPANSWQTAAGQSGQEWQQLPPGQPLQQTMPAVQPEPPAPVVPPAAATPVEPEPAQNWSFDSPAAAGWQTSGQVAPEAAPPAPAAVPAAPQPMWGNPAPEAPQPQPAATPQWQAAQPQPPQPAVPQPSADNPWAQQAAATQPQAPQAAQPSAPSGAWGQSQTNRDQVGAWQQPIAPAQESNWTTAPQQQPQPQPSQPQPDQWSAPQQAQQPQPVQPQPTQQPADPWAMPGQGQPDPWAQTGQGQQKDNWNFSQPGSSSAAQMFQEAAASLQDSTGKPDEPMAAQPAPATGGPLDLGFSTENEVADEQDKPKKRLSDLMPKLGPKT